MRRASPGLHLEVGSQGTMGLEGHSQSRTHGKDKGWGRSGLALPQGRPLGCSPFAPWAGKVRESRESSRPSGWNREEVSRSPWARQG